MKKQYFFSFIITGLLMLMTFSIVNGQEQVPPPENQTPNPNQTVRPFKIFEELGLTPEQIQQIRRINQERKPIMQEVQQKLREATRNLDLAIYADITNEDDIKSRMKDMQLAQAEVIRVRTLTEYQIRKVLTPEQLIKFRQLREQLMQRMEELKNRKNQDNNRRQRPANRQQLRKNQNQMQ